MKMTLVEARMLLRLAEQGEREYLDSQSRVLANQVLTKLRREVGDLEAEDRLGEAELQLRRQLHLLWLLAGEPSTRQMSRQIVMSDGKRRSNMTWHYALKCNPVPHLGTLRALVSYLDGDLQVFEDLWFDAKGVDRSVR